MSRISKLNSGRVQVTSPSNVSSDRYDWLSLDSAEPNLGTSGNGYVLTSNTSGSRIWTNNLSISNVTANTITANYFYGNAAFLTGLASSYGNIDVGNFLQQYTGNLTAGNIVANSVLINGNITSTYFFGNGSQLTGMNTYSNVQVAAFLEDYSGNISARDANFSGNVTIGGNLFVNGNVTTINANNLNISDSMIYLADDNPADILDIGFISSFTNPGYQHTGFVRDATDGVWKLFANVVAEPVTTVDFTNATYSNLKIGNLIAYNISGTITTASQTNITAVGTLGSLNITGNVLASNYVGGAVNVTGNVIAANIIATNFIGNGALLTGLAANYGNIDVGNFLQVYGGNISANIISANSINVTGNVLANNFVGSGALLTALPGYAFSNVNAISLITSLGLSNYSNVNVKAYTETMGFQNYGNTNVKAYTETMGFTNYSNVNLTAYLGGAVTIGGNLTVNGNLFVNGNVTTINANNLNISDSMIYLADDNPSDILDIGFVSSFTNPGYQHTGFVRDATDGVWKLFANVVAEPTTTVDFTNATYSNLQIGSLTSTGFINTLGNVLANNFVGRTVNVTGNVIAANIIATNFIGNGALLTGLAANYGNIDVGNFLQVYTGNIQASNIYVIGNIVATGNVIATNFIGNGAQLTGLSTYGNVNVGSFLQVYAGNISADNISANGINVTGNISGTLITPAQPYITSVGNLTSLSANGNITTTGYYFGNGSQLSGIVTSVTKIINGNTNMTAYDSSNIAVTINGSANTVVFTSSGIVATGNITASYYFGDASFMTGLPSTGNIQFNNTTITSNTDITIQTLTNGNIYLNAGGTGIVQIVGNDALGLPAGNDAARPLYPEVGYTRFNTDRQNIEFYDGNSWITVSTATISSEIINPDGAANTYTLGSNTTVDGILVSINGTLQRPTYSYTIANNNQIVFTEVPLTSDIVEVRFIAGSTTSVSSLRFGPNTSVILDSENVNVTGNIILNGSISGNVNGYSIGYREMPQVASGNVTLALSDSGKHFYNTTASPQTITIPSFANVAFGNGTVVSIANQSTSNISVALQSGVILYLAGNATSASRTITSYGVATLLKVNTNTWFINGSGVA